MRQFVDARGFRATDGEEWGLHIDRLNLFNVVDDAIMVSDIEGFRLYGSRIESDRLGLGTENVRAGLVYNNLFDSDLNTCGRGVNQIQWNLPIPEAGTNIVGGNRIAGNFWSDYTGTDLNGDGLGDQPYIGGLDDADQMAAFYPWFEPVTIAGQDIPLARDVLPLTTKPIVVNGEEFPE